MESVKSYTSGWTTSKSSMIKTHSKLHNDSENSYHEISQPRLKDLCADDKAKIGELVKKVALEKNQRLQIQNKVAKEMKDKQRELRNVKKLNKRLYEEAKNVRAQYEKSKEILEAYKQIATPAILSTPKSPSVFKNTNQE